MKGISKKLLSILLAVCLLASIALPAGLLTSVAESTNVIAYVDATTTETAGEIGNTAKPYKTISAAITALDALTGNVNRVIKIVGSYTCEPGVEAFSNNQFYGLATHTNLITIEGNNPTDATALVDITGVCSAGGPIKFDNIHFNIKNNTSVFRAGGFPVEFGANAVAHYTSGSYGRVASGGYHSGLRTDYETRVHNLITNQSFDHVILGDENPDKVYNIPGVNYVMNDGTVNRLAVGSSKESYPNNFTGNVNIELNGGKVNQVRMGASSYFFATYASGVAVQIIANNGMALNAWYYNSTTSTTPPAITDADGNANLYLLKVAKNDGGSTLSATATKGVYMVNKGEGYIPVVKDASGAEVANAYNATAGTVTVPAAGVYTVEWEAAPAGDDQPATDVIAYVDATTTETAGEIGNTAKPYKTISAAITALDALTGNVNRVIKIVGAYTCEVGVESFDATNNQFYGLATHTNLITIEGNDPTDTTALVDITGVCSAGGPLKFDNIHFNITNNTSVFYAGGFPVEFGPNAVPHYTSGSYGRVASGGYHQGLRTDYETRVHDLTTNQSFNHVILGDNNPNKIYTIPGVNYVMNGGTVSRLAVGSSKDTYPNHFTGNVNIELNGGKVEQVRMGASSYFFATYASGVAVQIIANNGMALNTWYYNSTTSTTPPTIMDADGNANLYLLKVAKNDGGSTLSATATKGVYTVNNGEGYIPVVKDASGAEVANAYNATAGTVTVPAAGVYTVEWEAAPAGDDQPATDVIAYVDATTTETAGEIGNTAKPYKTISAAITALDALTGNVNRVIKIVGSYTCEPGVEAFSNNQFYGLATHTNLITIEGNDPTDTTAVVDISGVCSAGGPLKFDNIRYSMTSNNAEFRANGFPVEFGANALPPSDGTHNGRLHSGGYHSGLRTDYETRVQNVVTNQNFQFVWLGDSNPDKVYNIPGVNYVMNGGTLARLAIGANTSKGAERANNFTGNVNIELNGGTVSEIRTSSSTYATYASGVALQVIANNGVTLKWKDGTNGAAPAIKDVDGNANLYVLKVAKNGGGSTLSATATKGVYTVNKGEGFTPVVKDESGAVVENAYNAEAKTITVPAAGVYTVEWEGVVVDPTVTAVELKNGNVWYLGEYRDPDGTQDAYVYTIKFEYYLPEESLLTFGSGAGYAKVTDGSADLKGGHNTAEMEVTVTKWDGDKTGAKRNAFSPYYKNIAGDAMLYVWNLEVALNGKAISLNDLSSVTTATVDTSKTLTQYPWHETMHQWQPDPTNPYVTAIDMSSGNKWYLGEYRDPEGTLDEYVWDIEFEYFMPERVTLGLANGPGFITLQEGSPALSVGHHTAKMQYKLTKYVPADEEAGTPATGAKSNAFIPFYSNTTAHDGMLYVWNMKVKLNGEEITLNPFNATKDNPQAPIDATKKLKEYPWYDYMNTVVDTTPPDVIAVDFTKGEKWVYNVIRAANYTHETPYEITFKYYLPEEYAQIPLILDSAAGSQKIVGGDAPYIVTGYHTFNGIYKCSANKNTFAPMLVDKTQSAKIYIWNVTVSIAGKPIAVSGSEHKSLVTAGVDESMRLNQYDWSETMKDVEIVPNETKDSQFMIKLDNYYFDTETSQTLKDQDFRQLVGLAEDYETGTRILPGRTYIYSFDYYSSSNLGTDARVWYMHSGSDKSNTTMVSEELEYDGRGHVEIEFTTKEDMYDLSVGLTSGVDGTGYYWNFSLVDKQTGEEMLLNTELIRPAAPTEKNGTYADWIPNSNTKDFAPNFTWIPIGSDEAKAILALKEGESLPEEEEEEEEDEEEEKKDEKEEKTNPLGDGTLYDAEKDIAMDFADGSGMGDEYALDIYEYADGELAAAILEKIGDLPYKAYDIQLVYNDAFVKELEKDIFLAIALPEGFSAANSHVYFCDDYGNLIDTAAYEDGGYLLLQYGVLGTFIIVDGEIADAGVDGEGDEPTDDPADGNDQPADTKPDDKDDKKDDKSNGWILWVAIGGGVILLAAAAVIILLMLKKKGAKADAE